MKKISKIMAGITALCLMGGTMAMPENICPAVSMTASAEATVPAGLTLVGKGSEGDFSCNYYSDGTLSLDGYSGTSSVVNIPEYINGKKVRSLMADFFYYNGVNVTDIYVPATVALVSFSGTGYTYAEAYSTMKSKYGLTLHMTGFDIPVETPYKYKMLDNGTIEITGCDKSATEVVIPGEIDGAKVTSIGSSSFSYCKSLTSINIPDGVTSIGSRAFDRCSSLTSINIPDGVTSIGSSAFNRCSSLASVTIPDSVTSIGSFAFEGCSGLTSITIPDGVTDISYAFDGCSSLTSINIPDSVTNISRAFIGCTGLTEITIPDSVTNMDCAFADCTGLTEITIPDGVTRITCATFQNCTNLTSISIPDSVTSIGSFSEAEESVFENCINLKSINIPDSVTDIYANAFKDCTGLTSITIPDSVTSIGGDAFKNCTNLTEITILNSECEIKDYNKSTISNGYDDESERYYFTGTIYGYENSTAQAYAEKYGYKFELLDSEPEQTTTTTITTTETTTTTTATTTTTENVTTNPVNPTERKSGDVNGDNMVDAVDASFILQEYALLSTGGSGNFTDIQKSSADVNGDGLTDAVDATFVLQYYAYVSTGGDESSEEFFDTNIES